MNWLDTPLLVYGALRGHPAEPLAATELRRGDWASTSLVLAELYFVLAQHYSIGRAAAAADVERVSRLPIRWVSLEADNVVLAAVEQARTGLESADAALMALARGDRGTLVTADRRLLRVAQDEGIAARNPIPRALDGAIADWEQLYLPPKGPVGCSWASNAGCARGTPWRPTSSWRRPRG